MEEDHEFKVVLNYITDWRLTLTTCDLVSRKRQKKIAKLKMMPESHEDKMEVSLKVVQSGKPKKAAHGESCPWKFLCLN